MATSSHEVDCGGGRRCGGARITRRRFHALVSDKTVSDKTVSDKTVSDKTDRERGKVKDQSVVPRRRRPTLNFH
jgi:hypothetical protein